MNGGYHQGTTSLRTEAARIPGRTGLRRFATGRWPATFGSPWSSVISNKRQLTLCDLANFSFCSTLLRSTKPRQHNMSQVTLPSFADTPADDIPKIVARTKAAFHTHKTRSVEFRLKQLRKLYWAVESHEDELREAVKRDLNKGFFDAMVSEIDWIKNDIVFITSHLEKWVEDEKPANVSFSNSMVNPRIRKDPLGIVLVIG